MAADRTTESLCAWSRDWQTIHFVRKSSFSSTPRTMTCTLGNFPDAEYKNRQPVGRRLSLSRCSFFAVAMRHFASLVYMLLFVAPSQAKGPNSDGFVMDFEIDQVVPSTKNFSLTLNGKYL
eukprot:COSAG05_NODE_288_length_12074_cov_119.196827_2_plen_121_part_00